MYFSDDYSDQSYNSDGNNIMEDEDANLNNQNYEEGKYWKLDPKKTLRDCKVRPILDSQSQQNKVKLFDTLWVAG